MTTSRLDQSQGCKKHLNFILGIVTVFQDSFGRNYFSRSLQREDNRGGRGMTE